MSVSKKTLDHGAKSYHFPTIPRAPRSAIPTRKRKFPHQIPKGCGLSAIDLLATVAGKLLEESECSSASSSAAVGFDWFEIDKVMIKNEPRDVDKEGDHDDQGSSEGSVFFSGLQKDVCIGKLETVNELSGELASPFASSVCSEKVDSDLKLITGKSNESFVYHSSKLDGGFPKCGETDDTNIKNRLRTQLDTNLGESGDTTVANKSTAPTNTEEDVELTLCRGSNPNTSFLKHGNNVKINCKDTDETISQCSQPKTMEKEFISPTSVRDFKLATSKYWKTAPKLKDYEESDTDGIAKRTQPSQRTYNEIEKSQRPLKKRIMFNPSSVVTYDGGFSSESVTNSPEKGIIDEKNASAAKLHEEKGTPSSGFCGQKSSNSRNSNVRLNIKSFKIPEFVIEAPESTTVGSLKSTVLEAVNAMLNNGLRVGVLVHGKKIQDDNRTLLQSGISQSDDINTVGFMLEPNIPTQPSPPVGLSEPPTSLPCGSPKLAIRSQFNTVVDTQNKPSITDSNRPTESIKGFVPSLTTERTDKTVFNSKAIVPVPEDRIEALAVVPVSHRSKRADIGQRRTRRPFSVFEVEALVRAVEELGTGRWRDVKLCAFENAKHRTYVDLKDKWKTLVHTARISPQQRRGEPVPQELLDRVLSAQSYWSEHQAKQHGKQLNHHHPQGIIPKLTHSVA